MLKSIRILPPLVFGRLGGSPHPMGNFTWGPDDVRPRGTGKTSLVPLPTLDFNDDGTLFERPAGALKFKDGGLFRPVCPFLELHGEWDAVGDSPAGSGPITPEILETYGGVSLGDMTWAVEVANLKPYHLTQNASDRIVANVSIRGDNVETHSLDATTPTTSANGLIPPGRSLPMGTVRLNRPNTDFPGLRLRFFPPKGFIYGPTNLAERLNAIPPNLRDQFDYRIPSDRLILNPDATWCRFNSADGDVRTNPGRLYAFDNLGTSLGLVDDVCDGIISCKISVGNNLLIATSRIAVGPPDYAPDRRPIVSLADGLKDRVDRAEQAVDDAWVRDLLERAWETMGLLHVEHQNVRINRENSSIAYDRGLPLRSGQMRGFTVPPGTANEPLPLTERARRRHRQLASVDALKNILRDNPRLFEQVVRPPAGDSPFYTIQMPALMRGSDRYPLHLTRRQYDMLLSWARTVIESP